MSGEGRVVERIAPSGRIPGGHGRFRQLDARVEEPCCGRALELRRSAYGRDETRRPPIGDTAAETDAGGAVATRVPGRAPQRLP